MTTRKELAKVRAYIRDDESTVECDKACEECEYIKACTKLDSEILQYLPDVRSFGAELCNKSTVFPSIDTASEERARKLYAVLCEMHIAHQLKKKWNALDIAQNLGVSVYRIRQRLSYLVDHKFVSLDAKVYKFSFGRNVSNLIRFFYGEFERRFGHAPVVTESDSGHISQLLKDYSDDDVKEMIRRYLSIEDDFIIKNGYSLRFLSSRVNYLLIEMHKDNTARPKSNTPLSQTQIDAYLQGKKDGKWKGTEIWAKQYEDSLNATQ